MLHKDQNNTKTKYKHIVGAIAHEATGIFVVNTKLNLQKQVQTEKQFQIEKRQV